MTRLSISFSDVTWGHTVEKVVILFFERIILDKKIFYLVREIICTKTGLGCSEVIEASGNPHIS